ncbi:MAG: hypothetical protein ACXWQO_13585 [Bdellovibrionota bacterium]
MKNPSLLLLALFLAPSAFAGKSSGVPETAKMLFQSNGYASSSANSTLSADTIVAKAVRTAELNIQQKIAGKAENAGFFAGAGDEVIATPINIEYECQAVYRVWSRADAESRDYARGGVFDGSYSVTTANVTVSVYCQPRDFRQKVAISAMQACEKEPKPECMSKDYMDMFGKIQQTIYRDINKP